MALRRNSLLAGVALLAAAGASPAALADDSTITSREPDHRNDYLDDNYIYDYMGHQDSITTGLGDAPTSNLIIMHPTPWPSYINNTKIKTPASVGMTALENMMEGLSDNSNGTVSSDVGAGPAPGSASALMPGAAVDAGAAGGN